MLFGQSDCGNRPILSVAKAALDLGFLVVAALAIHWPVLHSHALWPEDPQLWSMNSNLTAGEVLRSYGNFYGWYRPTILRGIPWATFEVLGWHHPVRLRAVGFTITVMAVWAVYAFTLRLFPGRRLAGVVAALCFASHPGLYIAILQFTSFDGLHILFVIAAVIFYLVSLRDSVTSSSALCPRAAEQAGKKSWAERLGGGAIHGKAWVGLSLVCYAIALTCKEAVVLTPVYLAAISGLAIAVSVGMPTAGMKRWFLDAMPIILREFRRLLPFAILMFAYVVVHLSFMAIPSTSGYRTTSFDALAIRQNIRNFSLWIARMFWCTTGPYRDWFGGYNRFVYNVIGLAFLVTVTARGIVLWRQDRAFRSSTYLCLMWIAVFLIAPVYCGGYGYHVNLALVGYAVLLGGAVESIPLLRRPRVGSLLACLLMIGWILLGRVNAREYLTKGCYHEIYTTCGNAFVAPPVPAAEVGAESLIYVENRCGWSELALGAGCLFRYVYDNKAIQERVVPSMDEVSAELATAWLNHPRAHFFSVGDDWQWFDNSKAFQVVARAAVQRGAEKLSDQKH